MERLYADILHRQIAAGADAKALTAKLLKHLEAKGRVKLLAGILRELKNTEARSAKLAPSVEVASEQEASAALAAAAHAGIQAKEAHVNPSLIRGWRARQGGTLVDSSAKRSLIELYRGITGA